MVMMTCPTALVAKEDLEHEYGETATHALFSDSGMYLISSDGTFMAVQGSSDVGRNLWADMTKAREEGKAIQWGTGRFSDVVTLSGFASEELNIEYRKTYRMK